MFSSLIRHTLVLLQVVPTAGEHTIFEDGRLWQWPCTTLVLLHSLWMDASNSVAQLRVALHVDSTSGIVFLSARADLSSGCVHAPDPVVAVVAVVCSTRNNELGRYFKGVIGEVIVYPGGLSTADIDTVIAYLNAQVSSVSSVCVCSSRRFVPFISFVLSSSLPFLLQWPAVKPRKRCAKAPVDHGFEV